MRKAILCLFVFFQCGLLQARETVVLIHGFLLAHFHMVPIERALRCDDFDIQNFEYPTRKNTIYGHGCNLVRSLNYMACQKPGEPINFVTHSIGALILRSALNHPECPQEAKIGKSVLLAPPNQGSTLGRRVQHWPLMHMVFGNFAGHELLTWTPAQMACIGDFPPCAKVLVVSGCNGFGFLFNGKPNDRFLLVEETRLNTPHSHVILPLSHGELITHPKTFYEIRKFLNCDNVSY